MTRVAVVGGGQAAASLVRKLRGLGFEGRISVFCREGIRPYARPPLSKKYLLDGMSEDQVTIFSTRFYADNAIDLFLSTEVTGLDPKAGSLAAGGESISYDHLVLATGATARALPPAIAQGLDGIHALRSLDDARALRAELVAGRRALIVGGGYIGLETAATAARRGLSVTVVELGDRILQRVATPALSDAVRALHRSNGVDIREGVAVTGLSGDGRVRGARLGDGTTLEVDLVIAGVGAEPDTGLARAAGLKVENGVWTDAFGQTSDSAIWAAGDCASFPLDSRRVRLESVQNAIDQAETVAENIMGANRPYRPVPTFWSEQFDGLIQIVGLNADGDTVVPRAGTRDGSQSFWLYGPDGLRAVEVVNDPKTFAAARRLVADGKSPPTEAIRDPATNLKSLLRQ